LTFFNKDASATSSLFFCLVFEKLGDVMDKLVLEGSVDQFRTARNYLSS
jgi:hypothetical protein